MKTIILWYRQPGDSLFAFLTLCMNSSDTFNTKRVLICLIVSAVLVFCLHLLLPKAVVRFSCVMWFCSDGTFNFFFPSPESPGTGSVPSVFVCLLLRNCDVFVQLAANFPMGVGSFEPGAILLLQSDRSDCKGGRSVVTGYGETSEYGKLWHKSANNVKALRRYSASCVCLSSECLILVHSGTAKLCWLWLWIAFLPVYVAWFRFLRVAYFHL